MRCPKSFNIGQDLLQTEVKSQYSKGSTLYAAIRHHMFDHLATYIFQYAQDYFQNSGVRCRLDLPARSPERPLSTPSATIFSWRSRRPAPARGSKWRRTSRAEPPPLAAEDTHVRQPAADERPHCAQSRAIFQSAGPRRQGNRETLFAKVTRRSALRPRSPSRPLAWTFFPRERQDAPAQSHPSNRPP